MNIKTAPLNEAQLDSINDILMKYGNDDSILDASELDGFLSAIVSGPDMIVPSHWFPVLWGGAGNEPNWESEDEMQQFMSLVFQHMNFIATMLIDCPEDFQALFNINPITKTESGNDIYIVEEWCFGYMKGVELGNWSQLPEELDTCLDAIALHGLEENFTVLETLSIEEHQQTVNQIEPAVRKLHGYFLQNRNPSTEANQKMPSVTPEFPKITPIEHTEPKTGRNDPCPCGSGKKYKKCCLH